jgi:outer membrane protein TolC
MKPRALLFACAALLAARPGLAADPYPADLPPLATVEKALLSAPSVLAAKSLMQYEEANRSRLDAGSYEWGMRLGQQQRVTRAAPGQRFSEWEVGLERPLRLPSKAKIDGALGTQGVAQAGTAYGDAVHEASRSLLKGWFAWLRERATREQWDAQVDTLQAQATATARRLALGDAPRLESILAEATLAQATAAREQARARETAAATELSQRFPALGLPAAVTLSTPQRLQGTAEYWQEQVFGHNHELALARGDSKRAQLLASRADADRTPDPTVGMRFMNERGGEEHIFGLSVLIPLTGQARAATARGALAQADAAGHREGSVLARLRAETLSLIHGSDAAVETWKRSHEAADRMRQAADLAARAHQLGEAALTDVLNARRQANEAALGARIAQLDALELRYRLQLDAHQLWVFDREADAHDHEHAGK